MRSNTAPPPHLRSPPQLGERRCGAATGRKGRYRRRRGSRAPGGGGRRARAGKATAGRTRSRPGRGSGGRGPRAGRSAPGDALHLSPQASDSRRGRLRPDSAHHITPWVSRGRLQRGPPGSSGQGGRLLPGHCRQHSPGSRTGSAQGSGGQRRARHRTLPLCVDRGTTAAGMG